MADIESSSTTLEEHVVEDSPSSFTTLEEHAIEDSLLSLEPKLASLPVTFVLPTNLSDSELHEIEDTLLQREAPLTYDITAANLVIGKISRGKRAKFELKRGKVLLDDVEHAPEPITPASSSERVLDPSAVKRRKLEQEDSSAIDYVATVETEINTTTKSAIIIDESNQIDKSNSQVLKASLKPEHPDLPKSTVTVVKLEWLDETLAKGQIQSFEPYILYKARLLSPQDISKSSAPTSPDLVKPENDANTSKARENLPHDIIERAKADTKPRTQRSFPYVRNRDHAKEAVSRDFAGRRFMPSSKGAKHGSFNITRHPSFLRQTTSEHDEEEIADKSRPVPDWVKEHKIYACERATPLESPNEEFLSQLRKIKLARILIGDEVGVRAYSSSIASIAAYPYPLASAREVHALPGCDQKISQLFQEWHNSDGHIEAVAEIEADPILKILNVFYEIWGVGASTAREFYYDRGWRDLDDIIEHGWKSLTRVQQIGVKFYDEFQLKMSRSQVEAIAATIQSCARRLTDDRLEAIIVGGYRRGKLQSGDADIILTHPSEGTTKNLISSVVAALETAGYITHTLTLALTNSKRNQQPLPLRGSSSSSTGVQHHGFDTLDKALVVWQEPSSPSISSPTSSPSSPRLNPHRRVDIIVSPYRTIGCAVAGWTSGTTFQRDLRRFAKRHHNWKFDSSGVRHRQTGQWIDLEMWTDSKTRCTDWQVAERRVFEGLGLVFREPGERCTG